MSEKISVGSLDKQTSQSTTVPSRSYPHCLHLLDFFCQFRYVVKLYMATLVVKILSNIFYRVSFQISSHYILQATFLDIFQYTVFCRLSFQCLQISPPNTFFTLFSDISLNTFYRLFSDIFPIYSIAIYQFLLYAALQKLYPGIKIAVQFKNIPLPWQPRNSSVKWQPRCLVTELQTLNVCYKQ